MANTVTLGPGVIQIVPDGSTDFNITDYIPGGIRLMGVDFGGASGDELKIRDKTATGPFLVRSLTVGETEVWTGKLDCFPFIKMSSTSDCTFAVAANNLILLYFQ